MGARRGQKDDDVGHSRAETAHRKAVPHVIVEISDGAPVAILLLLSRSILARRY
jgi:hypothetical protein